MVQIIFEMNSPRRNAENAKRIFLWFLVFFVAILNIHADFVTIGGTDVGADPATGYGAVNYTYQISRYEVTGAEFGAAVTADPNIGNSNPDTGNKPAEYVSWYEAVKYCNWLTSGDAYSGAYLHDVNGTFLGIDRAAAISLYGTVYVLPTEDEWYKAAYWRDDINDQWSLYAHGTDTTPTWGTTEGWNFYYNGEFAYGGDRWEVGYGAQEQNGTYDMMGNAWEWIEDLYDSEKNLLRGGADYYSKTAMSSTSPRGGGYSDFEYSATSFRPVMIPEPATALFFCTGIIGVWMLRRNYQKNILLTELSFDRKGKNL